MTPERWAQIESLYHQAQSRPPAERAAFLREACPADDSLRREVEDLLKQSGSDDGFLGRRRPAVADAIREAVGPSVLSGRSLGGYALEGLIGVGGMGEVYRARDAKLGRDVAIKVLPAAFTADPGRLARFEREARALAALNHPNVCAIYGFEESEGIRFLILELVEGETLADKLGRLTAKRRTAGGLSQREALNIARQIARALDVAHERGIVHRDLKPANIKITNGDVVKVLDFGLAKAVTGDGPDIPGGGAETATMGGTMDGAIVGTPAYMSPEQARGHAVDKRTDIWAFGCVLYEMLTGRAAFGGDTLSDTIASVLEREPDWSRLPADTPEPIRNLLVGCLAKDPRDRLRDIGDVRISIDSTLSGSSSSRTVAREQRPARRGPFWLPWMLTAGLGAGLAGLVIWAVRPPPSTPLTPASNDHRYPFELPAGQQLDRSGGGHLIAISRDGTKMLYVATPDRLYVRPMAELDGKPVPGTEVHKGVREPAFSPTGQSIVFYAFAARALYRIPVAGGQAVKIVDTETPFGISWAVEDMILFGQGRNGIWRTTPNGVASQVFPVEAGQEAHGPQLLPGRDRVLYTIASGDSRERWDTAEIVVGSLTTGLTQRLGIIGSDARYIAETGHLVFAVGNKLFAAPFDVDRLTAGMKFEVGIDVSRAGGAYTGAANFSVSDNGTLIYVPGAPLGPIALAFFRPDGTFEKQLALRPGRYVRPRASPKGQRVAFTDDADQPARIYTYDEGQTGTPTPFASGRFPVWALNGTRIAFQADGAIWWQPVDGDATPTPLTTPPKGESHAPESWSESRQTLLYRKIQGSGEGAESLWALPFHGGKAGRPQQVGRARSSEAMNGTFSPDGRLVAYGQTVRKEVMLCVEPFPGPGNPVCLEPAKPADTPKQPRWMQTAAGLRLFYNPRIGDFEVVSVDTLPLRLGAPASAPRPPGLPAMFRLAPPGQQTPYDITDDGRFLGLVTPEQRGYPAAIANKIVVMINWFDGPNGLKAKVPRSPVK